MVSTTECSHIAVLSTEPVPWQGFRLAADSIPLLLSLPFQFPSLPSPSFTSPLTQLPPSILYGVDGICESGQRGTVKNGGVENAGVDLSARYGKVGQYRRENVSKLA